MKSVLVFIYLAVALRIFIAVQFNDFKKAQYRLCIPKEDWDPRLLLSTYFLVFAMTIFWPVFFVIQPIEWVKGFIVGQKLAINMICFNFGKFMWRISAWVFESK